MKRFLIFQFFIFSFFVFSFQNEASAQNRTAEKKKTFVMLELFTSEGCPTCPPADANLASIEREQSFAGTEVVTLALHVDYWNSVSWKDVYSSPLFSRRQKLYEQALKIDQSYTPQMVVDGRFEFTGVNMTKARKSITDAAKIQKASIEMTAANEKLKIKINDAPAHQDASIFLAITEDKLTSNRKINKTSDKNPAHVSVVRNLTPIGMLTAAQTSLELETALQIQPDWKRENLKIVVFIQENTSRKILGVSRIGLD